MLKFIFWTFIIFLLLRWLMKPLLKVAVYHTAKKMANQMHQQHQEAYKKNSQPEGTVSIDYIPDNKKGNKGKNAGGGEYVDFEEVK
jgi:hypothetical protein